MSFPLAGLMQAYLPLILLVSIRVAAVFAAMPSPFGSLSPTRVRMALSVMVAATIVLPLTPSLQPVPLEAVALLRAGLGELLVGSVIGLTVRVTLAAVEIAGSVAGFSMGLGFATSVDPAFGEMALPTTRLLGVLGMLIFLVFQGHHTVLAALGASVVAAPPGRALDVVATAGVLEIGGAMLARGLQVAGPVVATMFIVQLGTALASRAAPRVHLFSFSFAIAIGAGVLTMLVAAPSLATAIAVEVRRLPGALSSVLGGL